jgi:signal transduction histidine kinase
MRRDFVANVSHELRTPLTVVHGYLELLDESMLDGSGQAEWGPMLDEMRRQSGRMTQLVEDLLTLSRLESRDVLADESVPMPSLLRTLRSEAAALSQGRHEIDVSDTAQVDLWGSQKELHSAFSNLVSNAVRYTAAGGRIAIGFQPLARKRRDRPWAFDRQARAQPAPGPPRDRERSGPRQRVPLPVRTRTRASPGRVRARIDLTAPALLLQCAA